MCNSGSLETRDQLFIHCHFARQCWKYICTKWNPQGTTFEMEVAHLKHLIKLPFSLSARIYVYLGMTTYSTNWNLIFIVAEENLELNFNGSCTEQRERNTLGLLHWSLLSDNHWQMDLFVYCCCI